MAMSRRQGMSNAMMSPGVDLTESQLSGTRMRMSVREFLGINLKRESRGVPAGVRIVVLATYVGFIAVVSGYAVSFGPLAAAALIMAAYALATWCAVWILRSHRRRHSAS